MSKLFKYYSMILASQSIIPLTAFAQVPLQTTVERFIDIVRLVVTLVFILAVVMFAWGIVKFIAAAGNPDEIKKAKGRITWGVIGIAVMASIFGLITYLQQTVGVQPGQGEIKPPTVP